jgi:HTH-type transcriptional regulator/antitoxin HigA
LRDSRFGDSDFCIVIGPDFLSTFRLKPIETIREWENARLWMVYLEAELHRRKREAEEEGLLQRNVDAVQDSAVSDSEAAVLDSTVSGSRLTGNPLSENLSEVEARFRRKHEQRKMPDQLTFEFTLSEVLEILGVFTKHFDRHYWFSGSGDVIKEIRYRMKIREFRNRDLVEEIGSKGYVSDILHRRKPLTLRTARVFRDFFDIPAEWLLSDYSAEDVL